MRLPIHMQHHVQKVVSCRCPLALERRASQLLLLVLENILCWVQKARELWRMLSVANSSALCCTPARETPFGVSLRVFYRNSRRKTTRSELATCPQPHIYNISCWFVKWVFRCGLALSMQGLAVSQCCLKILPSLPNWWSLRGRCRQQYTSDHFWSFPEGSTCHKNMFELFGRHPWLMMMARASETGEGCATRHKLLVAWRSAWIQPLINVHMWIDIHPFGWRLND